jgi:hypothetical protein
MSSWQWYSSARRRLDTLPEERTARLVGRVWMVGLPTAPVWNWFPRLIGLASGESECIRWYCRCSHELVDHAINTGLNDIDMPFRRRYYVEMLWQVSDCTICWDHQERDMNFLAKLCEWIIDVHLMQTINGTLLPRSRNRKNKSEIESEM